MTPVSPCCLPACAISAIRDLPSRKSGPWFFASPLRAGKPVWHRASGLRLVAVKIFFPAWHKLARRVRDRQTRRQDRAARPCRPDHLTACVAPMMTSTRRFEATLIGLQGGGAPEPSRRTPWKPGRQSLGMDKRIGRLIARQIMLDQSLQKHRFGAPLHIGQGAEKLIAPVKCRLFSAHAQMAFPLAQNKSGQFFIVIFQQNQKPFSIRPIDQISQSLFCKRSDVAPSSTNPPQP